MFANYKLFQPVTSTANNEEKRSFFKVEFANKGLDAINISNIFHHKSVQDKIPPYFNNKYTPVISYTYTKPIAFKIFNQKKVLENFIFKDIQSKPPECSCSSSPFQYSPAGHVVTANLNINYKGPKYHLPQSINWKYNFKLLMDAVEDYARDWSKGEKVGPDTLSE